MALEEKIEIYSWHPDLEDAILRTDARLRLLIDTEIKHPPKLEEFNKIYFNDEELSITRGSLRIMKALGDNPILIEGIEEYISSYILPAYQKGQRKFFRSKPKVQFDKYMLSFYNGNKKRNNYPFTPRNINQVAKHLKKARSNILREYFDNIFINFLPNGVVQLTSSDKDILRIIQKNVKNPYLNILRIPEIIYFEEDYSTKLIKDDRGLAMKVIHNPIEIKRGSKPLTQYEIKPTFEELKNLQEELSSKTREIILSSSPKYAGINVKKAISFLQIIQETPNQEEWRKFYHKQVNFLKP